MGALKPGAVVLAGLLGAAALVAGLGQAGQMGAEGAAPDAVLAPAALRRIYEGPPADWPAPRLLGGVALRELAPAVLPERPAPGSTAAREVALGADLFRDPRLSPSGQIACESCHDRQLGWGDGLRRSRGAGRQEGTRNAPALHTVHMRDALFWDGRADSLETQALGPLTHPGEMANPDMESLLARLQATPDLPGRFAGVHGDPAITTARLTGALAAFQRTLGRVTDLDRFLRGQGDALSDTQIRGLHVFRTQAGCLTCHNGPWLTDGGFHSLGLTFYGRHYEDLGRYGVTGDPQDAGAFRTPSLRHLSQTAPYSHLGIFPTLDGLLALYEVGGGLQGRAEDAPDPALAEIARRASPLVQPFKLTEADRAALLAFLDAL